MKEGEGSTREREGWEGGEEGDEGRDLTILANPLQPTTSHMIFIDYVLIRFVSTRYVRYQQAHLFYINEIWIGSSTMELKEEL